MSLRKEIFKVILENGSAMRLSEIYNELPHAKKHSIRARIYSNLRKGTKTSEGGTSQFVRIDKDLYDIDEDFYNEHGVQ